MSRLDNKERGITLIALVVTIIVLLILAGIAISLTIGNNGLFIRAGGAANTWRRAEANEQEEMRNFEDLYDNTLKDVGLGEKEEIEFTLNGTPYTVKDGTTWNEFFTKNFHDDYNWAYIETGEILHYVEDFNGTQAYFSYLVNEQNEKQKIDDKIRSGNYVNGETKTFMATDPSKF